MNFREYVFAEPYFGWLCAGVQMTLLITALTTILSLVLGAVIAAFGTSSSRPGRLVAKTYVSLFRNLPLVPLLLFLVFALPGVFQSLTGRRFPVGMDFLLLVLGLSLNTSAYIAEILRSGIQALPAEHAFAARVLGLKPLAIRISVVYPQALRIVLPALGTRLIHNMKNSAIALVLPLPLEYMEVVGQAGRIAGQTFAWAEPLLFAAAVHLSLAILFSLIVNKLAREAQQKIEVPR
jgi:His/Glu/Gln/Arg/opine family amino acid ABC transporter permease subunit